MIVECVCSLSVSPQIRREEEKKMEEMESPSVNKVYFDDSIPSVQR